MDCNKNNNDPNRLITVAIHTFDRAVDLKNTLEEEGIEVKLHNVNLDEKVLGSGVRVRIRERDLPLALQIIESPETTTSDQRCVLLPVDFGKYSLKSVKLGMEYARRSRGRVVLLHSYINERHTMSMPFGSDRYETPEDNFKSIKKNAKEQMEEFKKMLMEKIAAGELPKVKIETKVAEGIPEEQILHYARKYDVSLIVMGTSGTNRRRQNLIGSVAGEVMDACKFPIFTVPIGMPDISLTDITHVAFFSNLIQQDLLSFDRFARLFNTSAPSRPSASLPRPSWRVLHSMPRTRTCNSSRCPTRSRASSHVCSIPASPTACCSRPTPPCSSSRYSSPRQR